MKERIRRLTSRRWSVSMDYRIEQLNRFVRGWMGYFRLSMTADKFATLDQWFRRLSCHDVVRHAFVGE
ncbi:group II intron maturase-specific domain-containing protein [Glutamicibacter arilaitensis]